MTGWPRGVRKEEARLDEWMRDIAPSTELRRWYAHDPDRYAEFRRRYLAELRDPTRGPATTAGVRGRSAGDPAHRGPRPRTQPGRGPRELAERLTPRGWAPVSPATAAPATRRGAAWPGWPGTRTGRWRPATMAHA